MQDIRLTFMKDVLQKSPVGEVLPVIAALGLTDVWLAGGAIRNPIWKARFGEACQLGINDYDIAFWNPEGDEAEENRAKEILLARFPDYTFDVKNQASFGVWRWPEQKPYVSSADGISKWLHTATATGVRLDQSGEWEWLLPYGTDDLWDGIIRPTPIQTGNPAAEAKALKFLSACPALRIMPH